MLQGLGLTPVCAWVDLRHIDQSTFFVGILKANFVLHRFHQQPYQRGMYQGVNYQEISRARPYNHYFTRQKELRKIPSRRGFLL